MLIKITRSFFSIFLCVIFFMLGAGYFTSFQSLALKNSGYSETVIGVVQSAYYAGLLLGSIKIEPLIHRVGHIRALAACASISAVAIMLQGLIFYPIFWICMRFVAGYALSGLYVVIESWLLDNSSHSNRGQILSLYLAILYVSQALGQFFLLDMDFDSMEPYLISGMLCTCGVIPITLTNARSPDLKEPVIKKVFQVLRESPFGFLGCIISGMILSAIYSFTPNFAKENDLSPALLSSITIFGGVLLQWPIGKLSDIFNRRKVLLIISLLTIIPSLLIIFFTSFIYLSYFLAFILGGFAFTLYPLSLTQACDRIHPSSITSLTAVLLFAYGVGAVIGPLIAPLFMIPFGIDGLYFFIAFMAVVLSVIGCITFFIRKEISQEDQNVFVALPNTSPIAYDLDPRSESHYHK